MLNKFALLISPITVSFAVHRNSNTPRDPHVGKEIYVKSKTSYTIYKPIKNDTP